MRSKELQENFLYIRNYYQSENEYIFYLILQRFVRTYCIFFSIIKDKVNKIVKHNCNVFINRQLIYNYPEQLFADAGVMAIEHADFDGIERLALVTGGEIVSTFDNPELVKLGRCDVIEQVMIGEDILLRFGGVPLGEACTVIIRGATEQIVDEAER